MPLGHTNCPVIDGWQGRLQAKIAAAGVGGTLAGAVLAVLQQKQLLASSLGTAASCMICVGGFAVCQETSRLLRCEDSPANSVVAGAASGALLLGLQRGKNASLPAAIVCGSAAGIAHILDERLQPVYLFQRWLVDNDLMDKSVLYQQPPTRAPVHQVPARDSSPIPTSTGNTWGDTFGIKHLSDAEMIEYERQKKEKFNKRLVKAGLGPDERMVQQRQRPDRSS